MKLIILIGPHAVGKMTVGQELQKLNGFKLFHNHLTIEMVAPFFSYSTPEGRKLVNRLRAAFFDAFAESDEAGFIITFVCAFSEKGELAYVQEITGLFEQKGAEVFWVELEADLDERIRRNRTENRLRNKPSKRDVDWSDANLRQSDQKYRLNSISGEINQPNYLRIINTSRSPENVAQQIFGWIDQ